MASSTRSTRLPSKATSRRKPTTAEINEGITNAIRGFHDWDPFDNAAENIGETWRSLRGWHRFANSNGHGLEPFHSWALTNLPPDRIPRSLQLGEEIGYSAFGTYFPNAHKHFRVERWRLLLYFDNWAQLTVKGLVPITRACSKLSLNDMYDIAEQHRRKRTNRLGAYKNGQIDFKAFEFKLEDFQACLTRRRRQVRRSYGTNAETVPDDDESYHETSSESDVEDDHANDLDGHEEVPNDERGPESDHEENGQVYAEKEGQAHAEGGGSGYAEGEGQVYAEEDGLGYAEEEGQIYAEEDGQVNAEEEEGQVHAEEDRQVYAEEEGQVHAQAEEGQVHAQAEDGPEDGHDCVENDRQVHGASGDTNCSPHLQSIFSKLLDAKEEEIRSSQQCVSYGRSLLDKFETLSEQQEVMLLSLNETEETVNAKFQAVSQRFLLSHENFRPEDGGFSEKALTKFKSEVSGLGSLLHKRRIDGEELADNGVKRAKVEGEIAELMTWTEDNTRRRLVVTNNT